MTRCYCIQICCKAKIQLIFLIYDFFNFDHIHKAFSALVIDRTIKIFYYILFVEKKRKKEANDNERPTIKLIESKFIVLS